MANPRGVKMKLNEAIINIRVELQSNGLKMSGKNTHAGFSYFELSDFLPKLNELMKEKGINDCFSITHDEATLTLIKEDEKQEYKMPFFMFEVPLTSKGSPMMQQIQYLGAINTYLKRYLYMNAFGITDGEVIDNLDNDNLSVPSYQPKADKEYISEIQAKELYRYCKEQNSSERELMTFFKVDGLMKLTTKQYSFAMSKIKNGDFKAK